MNLPNKLSMFRIILVPVLVYFYYQEMWYINAGGSGVIYPYFLAPIFIVASITDFLDGYIARKRNLVTTFGKFIDPLADKLIVMAALLILTNPEQLDFIATIPIWIPIIIMSREFIVTGIRLVAVGDGKVIAASKLGKYKTATTMVALVLLLMFPYYELLADIGIWILYVGVILTVVSGIDYFIKNKEIIIKSI
jgi:CDP-diacylglycerol--glycerol-3-phosphate 3-phosphatidyltransferase